MKGKWFLLLILSLIFSIMFSACGFKGNERTRTSSTGQILNLLEAAELPTMDTTQADDSASFSAMNQVFEGLFRLGPDNTPVPGVAKEVIKSKQGHVLTFILNEDANWSDGSKVTAHDFIYAWKKALTPETLSPYAYLMKPIKNAEAIMSKGDPLFGRIEELGVKALDNKTLEVTLEIPVPYFISLTSFPTFFPQKQEYVKEKGSDYALYADKMLYNGPFLMSNWSTSGWTFKKNPEYWDRDIVKLDQINYRVIKDSSAETNLFETGQADRAGLSAELVELYKDHPDFLTYSEPTMWYLKFNVDRIPIKQRKAIQRAINKEAFVTNLLNNGSLPADYFFPSGFVKNPTTGEDFRKKYGNIVSYNVEEAQHYWQEAGSPTVTWDLLINDRDEMKMIAEYIKNQLETTLPGLTININVQPFKQRLALDDAIDYDIQFWGWGPDYQDPLTFMDLWVTNGGNNKTNYASPVYDNIIREAVNNLDDLNARFESLQDAEVILLKEDAVIAPLYQRGRAVLQKHYVKDLIVHPFGPDYSFKWAYIENKDF
ncbi:peptide ABC transporter substrate-binding protein [Schinkia azotoformans]|uniref:Oligopeptide ABC transporter periplasmic protein n=1 Tax=Schinkia azotoformans LMG 9581 TaxID=1131731 RepID=K6D516_SCHAZ|nr:peptide ABC transporter substrate-binding protein [Schinkia azotoformans]EKN63384.1 oligopeptide ABC transporter periplasmic protein [Schinkia azotoformans LMG 9581]MEC1638683.1 peptide ABC transporter substrate-binding protein [Schinkia azotoformans]MEC1719258.1 peptide ABC transporter substrate-binding protein [Schinkia azotoformans]MEC1946648.1 peptide ABC transporter substrate-binding protein [Schinkia azotoformans]MED4413464.1 peptide ABC transporter substrate-binding protein [Schinkia